MSEPITRAKASSPFMLTALLMAGSLCSVQAADLRVVLKETDGSELQEAVVMLRPASTNPLTTAPTTRIIDQVDRAFVPQTRVVSLGSAINFPNKDDIRHHVYSFSEAKSFELPLYSGTPAAPVVFDKVGVVTLGCNIHDWMRGYIVVTDAPYFTDTGTAGVYSFRNVPEDDYIVEVWHSRQTATQNLKRTIKLKGSATIEIQLETRPKQTVRRAPRNRREGY